MDSTLKYEAEIERLSSAITDANREKVQAAKYGLAVLEEKHHMQAQIEDIETKYETIKLELEHAKEVNILVTIIIIYDMFH